MTSIAKGSLVYDIAEDRGAFDAPLSEDQRAFLQVTYDLFREHGRWPSMYDSDRALMRRKKRALDSREIWGSIPRGLLFGTRRGMAPSPQDQVMLTMAGVERCEGAEDDVQAFLYAVRWCVRYEMRTDPPPGQNSVRATRRQVTQGIPIQYRRTPGTMDRLLYLLQGHHWGLTQSGRPDNGRWDIHLGQDVRRFAGVRTIREFIDVRISWVEGDSPRQWENTVAQDQLLEPPTPAYVHATTLRLLREAPTAGWDTHKLLALAEELDDSFRAGRVYAAHALLRALLDHVPPLFGQEGFAGVVNQHPWSTADKRYMKRLAAFREQADDALHRQIDKLPCLLAMDDMPPSPAVNSLLRGCAGQLIVPMSTDAARHRTSRVKP